MDSKHAKFLSKYSGKDWEGTQEDMFYDALINLVRHGLTDEGVPALSGAYLNSYERLMGILVQEVGTRSTPASKMVLKSFLAWEREIRKELTEPAWQVRVRDVRFLVRIFGLSRVLIGLLASTARHGWRMDAIFPDEEEWEEMFLRGGVSRVRVCGCACVFSCSCEIVMPAIFAAVDGRVVAGLNVTCIRSRVNRTMP